jgi:acyl-CoA thioester hydrolase
MQPVCTKAARALLLAGHKGLVYPKMLDMPVKWGELDALNHLNNVQFFKFFEEARIHSFTVARLPVDSSQAFGPIIAETSCAYKAPVKYPDTLVVGVNDERLGENAWLSRYACVSAQSGRVVAEGKASIVWVNYTTGKRAPIPDDIAGRLFDPVE